MVVPFPKPGLELFMEDLETSCLTSPECHPSRVGTSLGGLRNFGSDQPRRLLPPPGLELVMDDLVWWTGVWRLLLYPPKNTV